MTKKVPEFRSAEEERAYWAETGSDETGNETGGLKRSSDRSSGKLKYPEKSVCLRLPGVMLEELRVQAHMMGVPQKTLIKTYLAERIEREMRREREGSS